MKVIAYIRASWRNGWGILDTLRQPTLTVSIQRTGWVGDASFEAPHEYPLGAELQLIRTDTGETLWLGKIVARNYRSTEKRWRYELRGICEHFLDLPIPLPEHNFEHTRTPSAWVYWERHLKNHIWRHTPRYEPIYQLALSSFRSSTLTFRTVRDVYKLYQTLAPCKIVPNLLSDGRIEMILDNLPAAPYPLPSNTHYELSESILETANRISLSEPAQQLLKDRRLANSNYWELVVPPGASASVRVQDHDEYGYLGAYATRLSVVADATWVALRYREPIKTPKDATGNRYPVVVGFRARGTNARVRISISGVPSSPQTIVTPNTYAEYAYAVTPIADEFTLAIEIQRITPPLAASLAIDAVYCIPASTTPLNERDYPPHLIVTDQIPSFLTGGILAQISEVTPMTGGYQLSANWSAFPSNIPAGTPVQILQNSRLLTGVFLLRDAPTTIRVQMPTQPAPQPGDWLYIPYSPDGAAGQSELLYDTLYIQLDTPAARATANLADLVAQIATPTVSLTAQFPLKNAPLPQIGQTVPHPHTNEPLPIYEVELPIVAGNLSALQIRAGSPDLTMRALFRRLNPARTRQV